MTASTIAFVVGARPNFIKAAPVVTALRALSDEVQVELVHTGQHYDEEMSDAFFHELDLPAPDVSLGVGSGPHGAQTARAIEALERTFVERGPSLVVVVGDVNSTLAGALAAAKLAIPVAHLEAGLRSFDPLMPEEINRKLTDHVASLLLTHSQSADDNLIAEGIDAERIHLVGNSMIDTLMRHVDAARAREPWRAFELTPHGYALVTLHRPALVDDGELLASALEELARLARATGPVVFPVHPRTRARIDALGATRFDGVVFAPPQPYLSFLGLEAEAAFVLTDSGGVQEETSALAVPCFTLRDTTERPVTVELGTNTVLGLDPAAIAEIPSLLERPRPATAIPLWDGRAGPRAAEAIARFVERPALVA